MPKVKLAPDLSRCVSDAEAKQYWYAGKAIKQLRALLAVARAAHNEAYLDDDSETAMIRSERLLLGAVQRLERLSRG